MSRTRKGAKGPGFDYTSRRPAKSASAAGGYQSPGPFTKRLTHRSERRVSKRIPIDS